MENINYLGDLSGDEKQESEKCMRMIREQMQKVYDQNSVSDKNMLCSALKGEKTKISNKIWKEIMKNDKLFKNTFRLLETIDIYYCPLYKRNKSVISNNEFMLNISVKDKRTNEILDEKDIRSDQMHFIRFQPNITIRSNDKSEIEIKFSQKGQIIKRNFGYVFVNFTYKKTKVPYLKETDKTLVLKLKDKVDVENRMKRYDELFKEMIKKEKMNLPMPKAKIIAIDSPRISRDLSDDIIKFKENMKKKKDKEELSMKMEIEEAKNLPPAMMKSNSDTMIFKNKAKMKYLMDTGAPNNYIYSKSFFKRNNTEGRIITERSGNWGGIGKIQSSCKIEDVIIVSDGIHVEVGSALIIDDDHDYHVMSISEMLKRKKIDEIVFMEKSGLLMRDGKVITEFYKKGDGRWFLNP